MSHFSFAQLKEYEMRICANRSNTNTVVNDLFTNEIRKSELQERLNNAVLQSSYKLATFGRVSV